MSSFINLALLKVPPIPIRDLLSPLPLLVTLSALGLLYCTAWIVYARVFHPLAKFPGPFLASITPLWYARKMYRETFINGPDYRSLHERYGPIFRIAPQELSIADPEAIKTIYSVKSGFVKSDWYTIFTNEKSHYPDLFTMTDEKQHSERQKIANHLYTMTNVLRFESRVDHCSRVWEQKMSEIAGSEEVIDLARWVLLYASDVIGEVFFGQDFGYLKAGYDHTGIYNSIDTYVPIASTAGLLPKYLRLPFILSSMLSSKTRKGLANGQKIQDVTDKCLEERAALIANGEGSKNEAIVTQLFNIMHEKGEKLDFNILDVRSQIWSAIIAGSDTTSTAINSILYHLLTKPQALNTLLEEIDSATAAGQLSSPNIRYSEAIKLPYLDACCKEGMRLRPSFGMMLPRVVPGDGCQIAGAWIPGGMIVGVDANVIHRNRSIFGEDADEFVPERWMREGKAEMERSMFQFGGGTRLCSGKNMALSEMYKIIPQMLRSYHFELVEPEKPWTLRGCWFVKPSNVNVRVHKRGV